MANTYINPDAILDGSISIDKFTSGTVETHISESSRKPVESAAIYAALQGKVSTTEFDELAEDAITKTAAATEGISASTVLVNGIRLFTGADNDLFFDTESVKNSKGEEYATKQNVDAAVNAIISGAPEAYNTLKKISDELKDGESTVAAILNAVSVKADRDELRSVAYSANYEQLNNKPFIPNSSTAVSYFRDDNTYLKKNAPELQVFASKDYVDERVKALFTFKGNVNTWEELTAITASQGDCYRLREEHEGEPANTMYIWQGERWEVFMEPAEGGETSIINVDELPLTDIRYDKLYQINKEKVNNDMYFFIEGMLIKNELRWEGEGNGIFCKVYPVEDWETVERRPVFVQEDNEDTDSSAVYISVYLSGRSIYYFNDVEGEPVIFNEDHPCIVAEPANATIIKQTLLDHSNFYFTVMQADIPEGTILTQIVLDGVTYTYTVDSEFEVHASDPDAPEVELRDVMTEGNIRLCEYRFKTDGRYYNQEFEIILMPNIHYVGKVMVLIAYGGFVTDEKDINMVSAVPVGTTAKKDADFYYRQSLPNHSHVLTTVEDGQPIYFYSVGKTMLPDDRDVLHEYEIHTLAYDYVNSGDTVPMDNNLFISLSAVGMDIINADGSDYRLVQGEDEGMYALVDDDDNEFPYGEFIIATDTHAYFMCDGNTNWYVPKTLEGQVFARNTESGIRMVDVYDSAGNLHTIELSYEYYLTYVGNTGEWQITFRNPETVDLDGNVTSWKFDNQYININETKSYISFNWLPNAYEQRHFVPGVCSGLPVTGLIDNAIIINHEVSVPMEEGMLIPLGDEYVEYIPASCFSRSGEPEVAVSLSGACFVPISETAWFRSDTVQKNEMYYRNENAWARVLSDNDLSVATQGYVTAEDVSKYVTINNFVYIQDGRALPDSEEADSNKFYIKDGIYWHWNRYNWRWDSFKDIIPVPSYYPSIRSYATQNEISSSKIYLVSSIEFNKTYPVPYYSYFGGTEIENTGVMGPRGMYYHPLALHYCTLYNGMPSAENIVPFSLENGVYHMYVVDVMKDFYPYDREGLNNKFKLYYYADYMWHQAIIGSAIRNDGPIFGGFLYDDAQDKATTIHDNGYFYVGNPQWHVMTTVNLWFTDGTHDSMGMHFEKLNSGDNIKEVLTKVDNLPSISNADINKLYLFAAQKDYVFYRSSIQCAGGVNGRINAGNLGPTRIDGTDYFMHNLGISLETTPGKAIPENETHMDYSNNGWVHYEMNNFNGSSDGANTMSCNFTYNVPDNALYFNQMVDCINMYDGARYELDANGNHKPLVLNYDWLIENEEMIPGTDNLSGLCVCTISGVTGERKMFISKTGTETLYVGDTSIDIPLLRIRYWNVNDGAFDPTVIDTHASEADYKCYGGTRVSLDIYAPSYEIPVYIYDAIGGLVKVCQTKNWNITNDYNRLKIELPYHYAMYEPAYIPEQDPMSYVQDSICLDGYVRDGEKLFECNGKSYYFFVSPNPGQPEGTFPQWKIIADVSNKEQLYDGNYWNYDRIVSMFSFYADYYRYIGQHNRHTPQQTEEQKMIPYNSYDQFYLNGTGATFNTDIIGQTVRVTSPHVIKGFMTPGEFVPSESFINVFATQLVTSFPDMNNATIYPIIKPRDINALYYLDRNYNWKNIDTGGLQKILSADNTLNLNSDAGTISVNKDVMATREYVDAKAATLYRHRISISFSAETATEIDFELIDARPAAYVHDDIGMSIFPKLQGQIICLKRFGYSGGQTRYSGFIGVVNYANSAMAQIMNPTDGEIVSLHLANYLSIFDNVITV